MKPRKRYPARYADAVKQYRLGERLTMKQFAELLGYKRWRTVGEFENRRRPIPAHVFQTLVAYSYKGALADAVLKGAERHV